MPALYYQGARKAYKRHTPAYSDTEPVEEQKKREWMLREQIRRHFKRKGVDFEKIEEKKRRKRWPWPQDFQRQAGLSLREAKKYKS
ncbi:hypothetical protein KAX97_11915 [candidate division WOR-3 bacterium]|nr:hypothetical protein [candidate division WOR-3 bacterium]